MDYRILGPLEVDIDDRPVRFAGPGQRIVLCALLTVANDVASVDRIIDWLWPARPPRSAAAIVQAHISRLRRLLEPHRSPWAEPGLLVRRFPGYLMRVGVEELDAARFERLVNEGRGHGERGDHAAAAATLGLALGLWRGSPLADVAFVAAAQNEIARLEALRLCATVARIDADLRLGRHYGLIPELEAMVRAHPLDERLAAQLMIALYRCGRQADSLGVYDRIRHILASELDIAPAPESQRLRAAIRSQHPELDAPPGWQRQR